jgi:hypothetical protein
LLAVDVFLEGGIGSWEAAQFEDLAGWTEPAESDSALLLVVYKVHLAAVRQAAAGSMDTVGLMQQLFVPEKLGQLLMELVKERNLDIGDAAAAAAKVESGSVVDVVAQAQLERQWID